MVCEHLAPLERALLEAGAKPTFRGQAWSSNCREWVYFDAWLDLPAIRAGYAMPDFVEDHEHRGTHDGQERGLVCTHCHDAVMGRLEQAQGQPRFPSAPGTHALTGGPA